MGHINKTVGDGSPEYVGAREGKQRDVDRRPRVDNVDRRGRLTNVDWRVRVNERVGEGTRRRQRDA
jgi:hypothetical protein